MYAGSGQSQHYDLFAGAPCTMPPNTLWGWEASFRQTRNFSSSSELTKVVQKLGALPVNHRHCGIRTIPKPQKNLQLNLEKPPTSIVAPGATHPFLDAKYAFEIVFVVCILEIWVFYQTGGAFPKAPLS